METNQQYTITVKPNPKGTFFYRIARNGYTVKTSPSVARFITDAEAASCAREMLKKVQTDFRLLDVFTERRDNSISALQDAILDRNYTAMRLRMIALQGQLAAIEELEEDLREKYTI